MDLDKKLAEIDRGTPFIVTVTTSEDAGQQFFIAVEKTLLAESSNIIIALLDLVSAYFVFDIVYPKNLHAVLIFIQHYLLGLVDKQAVPQSVKVL